MSGLSELNESPAGPSRGGRQLLGKRGLATVLLPSLFTRKKVLHQSGTKGG